MLLWTKYPPFDHMPFGSLVLNTGLPQFRAGAGFAAAGGPAGGFAVLGALLVVGAGAEVLDSLEVVLGVIGVIGSIASGALATPSIP